MSHHDGVDSQLTALHATAYEVVMPPADRHCAVLRCAAGGCVTHTPLVPTRVQALPQNPADDAVSLLGCWGL